MADFTIRSGDTGRPLVVLLKNQDGSDAIIPGGTTCVFNMVHRQTRHSVTPAAVALANSPFSTNGNQVTVSFEAADTQYPGVYDAVWLVTYPGGLVETFPTSSRGVAGYSVEVYPTLADQTVAD